MLEYNGFGNLGLGDSGNRGDAPNEMGINLPYVDLGTVDIIVYVTLYCVCMSCRRLPLCVGVQSP
jgi:hypothetical protein